MTDKSKSKVQEMFGEIAARYDLANSVLSFGIHKWWRRALLKMVPTLSGAVILDLCTGTGEFLPALGEKGRSVVGVDFCFPMLAAGKERAPQVVRIQGDGLMLPFISESFDCVTIGFGVRNFERLELGLREIKRVLKPGGSALILEFGQPTLFPMGILFKVYSSVLMPLLGGLLTGNKEAYTYLPKTSAEFPCGDRFKEILLQEGFSAVAWKSLTGGIAYCYRAIK